MNRRGPGDGVPKRGRFDRPTGRFRLAPNLTSPGGVPLADAVGLVSADWDRQAATGQVSTNIVAWYKRQILSLVGYADAAGAINLKDITSALVETWMQSPTRAGGGGLKPAAQNTRYARRSAARTFFSTATCLALFDQNPAKVVEESKRTPRYVHSLTDGQIRQLQDVSRASLGDTKIPATLALVLQGAATGELSYITVGDIDLPRDRVRLHSPSIVHRDRWVPLRDDWSRQAFTDRLAVLARQVGTDLPSPDRLFVYDPATGPDSDKKRSAVAAVRLTDLMRKARVYTPGVTRVESIREWVAGAVYAKTGGVEAVAVRLGMSSLDAAAHLVGHDWASQFGETD